MIYVVPISCYIRGVCDQYIDVVFKIYIVLIYSYIRGDQYIKIVCRYDAAQSIQDIPLDSMYLYMDTYIHSFTQRYELVLKCGNLFSKHHNVCSCMFLYLYPISLHVFIRTYIHVNKHHNVCSCMFLHLYPISVHIHTYTYIPHRKA
jgi:hypothetical protein